MTPTLLGVAVLLVALPRVAWRLGRRLHPREWVILGVAAVFVGAAALELGLILLALPTVLRGVGVPDLAAACRRLLGDLAPGGTRVGWTAALLSVAVPVLFVRGHSNARAALATMTVEPDVGVHVIEGGIEFVLLDTAGVVAYSVDGDTRQVVTSQGLLHSLSVEEHQAVLRHEVAHLRCRHQRLLLLLTAIEAAVPSARLTTPVLRTGIERWADEESAGRVVPARRTLCDALLHVAGVAEDEPAVAAFASVQTTLERVRGLIAGPPAPRPVERVAVHTAMLATSLLGVAALAGWLVEAQMMLAAVRLC